MDVLAAMQTLATQSVGPTLMSMLQTNSKYKGIYSVRKESIYLLGLPTLVRRVVYSAPNPPPYASAVGWVVISDITACMVCSERFSTIFPRKQHCRACGNVVCLKCSPRDVPIAELGAAGPVKVCIQCDAGQDVIYLLNDTPAQSTNISTPSDEGSSAGLWDGSSSPGIYSRNASPNATSGKASAADGTIGSPSSSLAPEPLSLPITNHFPSFPSSEPSAAAMPTSPSTSFARSAAEAVQQQVSAIASMFAYMKSGSESPNNSTAMETTTTTTTTSSTTAISNADSNTGTKTSGTNMNFESRSLLSPQNSTSERLEFGAVKGEEVRHFSEAGLPSMSPSDSVGLSNATSASRTGSPHSNVQSAPPAARVIKPDDMFEPLIAFDDDDDTPIPVIAPKALDNSARRAPETASSVGAPVASARGSASNARSDYSHKGYNSFNTMNSGDGKTSDDSRQSSGRPSNAIVSPITRSNRANNNSNTNASGSINATNSSRSSSKSVSTPVVTAASSAGSKPGDKSRRVVVPEVPPADARTGRALETTEAAAEENEEEEEDEDVVYMTMNITI